MLSNITKREEVNHMSAFLVFLLGAALIAILAMAHDSWEEIHDDSENEK